MEKTKSKKKSTKAAFVELGTSDEDEHSDVEACLVSVNSVGTNSSRDTNIDSGCGKSMTPHEDNLTNLVPRRINVCLADDSIIKSTHVGSASLPIAGSPSHKMLVVPALQEPLLSVSQLCDGDRTICFTSEGCYIFNNSSLEIASVGHSDGVGV